MAGKGGKVTRVLLALDQGTQSTRAIVYELPQMRAIATHQMEHRQIMSQAGYVLLLFFPYFLAYPWRMPIALNSQQSRRSYAARPSKTGARPWSLV